NGNDRSQHVQLHGAPGTDLFGDDASGLLRKAARHEVMSEQPPGKQEKPVVVDRTVPSGATVHSERIAGPQYRVFVMPFEPNRKTMVGSDEVQRLYIIGLKRQDVLGAISDAMGSGG